MSPKESRGFGPVIGWLAFPAAPVVLATAYHRTCNIAGVDPRDWDGMLWIVMAGPLFGYAFLAGATAGFPDAADRRGRRPWLARRAVWVAVGPWLAFLVWAGISAAWRAAQALAPRGTIEGASRLRPAWLDAPAAGWAMIFGLVGSLAFGWVAFAAAALRRAHRAGRPFDSLVAGLLTAIGFVGSLFGGFWAVTEGWRSYFFDPRMPVLLLAATGLVVFGGCGAEPTVGDVRRRELFGAMLSAWVLGLALTWRWWSRPRGRQGGGSADGPG